MEYYGKILCISYNDLTYDDRPVMVNGKADYSTPDKSFINLSI